jgi:hypothetical protein
VPRAVCEKRYHVGNLHTTWDGGPAHQLSLASTLVRYARSYSDSTGATVVALAAIARVTIVSPIAGPVRRRIRRALRGAPVDSP